MEAPKRTSSRRFNKEWKKLTNPSTKYIHHLSINFFQVPHIQACQPRLRKQQKSTKEFLTKWLFPPGCHTGKHIPHNRHWSSSSLYLLRSSLLLLQNPQAPCKPANFMCDSPRNSCKKLLLNPKRSSYVGDTCNNGQISCTTIINFHLNYMTHWWCHIQTTTEHPSETIKTISHHVHSRLLHPPTSQKYELPHYPLLFYLPHNSHSQIP